MAEYHLMVNDNVHLLKVYFNPIHDGGQKGPPTRFSPVTSTSVGISPQNCLSFSFNWCSSSYLVPVPNY